MGFATELEIYLEAWMRGAADQAPTAFDETSLRGHKNGVRARARAIEKEGERLGYDLGPATLGQVSARVALQPSRTGEVEIGEVLASRRLLMESETDDVAPAPPVAAVEAKDPMLEQFAKIRARAKLATDVPNGTKIDHEWFPHEDDEEPKRRRPQPGTPPIRHSPRVASIDEPVPYRLTALGVLCSAVESPPSEKYQLPAEYRATMPNPETTNGEPRIVLDYHADRPPPGHEPALDPASEPTIDLDPVRDLVGPYHID